MFDCRECIHYERTHYKDTPKDEVYDECTLHNEILHELDGCIYFKHRGEGEEE